MTNATATPNEWRRLGWHAPKNPLSDRIVPLSACRPIRGWRARERRVNSGYAADDYERQLTDIDRAWVEAIESLDHPPRPSGW